MKISSYKDLVVWQKSVTLTKEVYHATNLLPREEMYGLTSQMRRSAVSVPSDIAEGYQRRGRTEFVQFLSIAKGSLAELQTQVLISKDIYKTVKFDTIELLIEEVQKMLFVMTSKLSGK